MVVEVRLIMLSNLIEAIIIFPIVLFEIRPLSIYSTFCVLYRIIRKKTYKKMIIYELLVENTIITCFWWFILKGHFAENTRIEVFLEMIRKIICVNQKLLYFVTGIIWCMCLIVLIIDLRKRETDIKSRV